MTFLDFEGLMLGQNNSQVNRDTQLHVCTIFPFTATRYVINNFLFTACIVLAELRSLKKLSQVYDLNTTLHNTA